ncbi:LysR family transcriptional regulator [Pyxidicoccus fallax]|uniref:LysR family transcriptional regulator n=1 Tax=Pyxidicoccus fallax TaxID=394095 RepID=A0A848LDE7_9BACT|nr:LysR family transcriptional regulator [Pyxidicoccus fallax]NMO17110.1 LysR family transcriptional regulator [Pyxidicoccus fallax]NPC78825.1 LysR family transcriptional regulator [Pyxidicoccus fallax]
METLITLESFVRSAQSSSFSAAARSLGLTPAGVSQNVARLEKKLGVRLFQRSTRGLTLTESGERFLQDVSGGLDTLQSAIANVTTSAGKPSGMLKVSMAPVLGRSYLVPLLKDFLAKYPGVVPDWHFDTRRVDIIKEGFDAAIGGGFELPTGMAARELARAHIVAVASPSYLALRAPPRRPADLKRHDGLVLRSPQTGRIRTWPLRNREGDQVGGEMPARVIFNDPEALTQAALMGLGIAFVSTVDVVPHLREGTLVRVLPDWHADIGPIALYYPGHRQLPAKTRVFVDFVTAEFKRKGLARLLSAV